MSALTDAPDLTELLLRVYDARRAMDRARRSPSVRRHDTDLARHDLVDALEAYTSGLDACNTPVPYGLRNELRLNRGLDN